jgi:hypothetical protein
MAKQKEEKMNKWMWRHFGPSNVFTLYHVIGKSTMPDGMTTYDLSERITFISSDKRATWVKEKIEPTVEMSHNPLQEIGTLLKNNDELRMLMKIALNESTIN